MWKRCYKVSFTRFWCRRSCVNLISWQPEIVINCNTNEKYNLYRIATSAIPILCYKTFMKNLNVHLILWIKNRNNIIICAFCDLFRYKYINKITHTTIDWYLQTMARNFQYLLKDTAAICVYILGFLFLSCNL